MSFDDFIGEEKELFDVLDKLLPAFLLWNNRTQADRENAKKYYSTKSANHR